ncbi:MAG TPA: hypothetical protein PKB07_15865 [Flavilitoribacter sp.]|nr:hypothetical protein [Flavilitoribacter sp.]
MTPDNNHYIELLTRNLTDSESVGSGLAPLRSILGSIGGKETKDYFASGLLDLGVNMMAENDTPKSLDFSTESVKIWDKISSFYANSPWQDSQEDALAYTAYHFGFAYGSRVAQSGKEDDASLFDQNRVAAARWICENHNKEKKEGRHFLLVKGDISGIQEFIYNNIETDRLAENRKLAKRLRGRSSFIALMTDWAAEELIRRLGLQLANIIFSGGGHFNLLVPNYNGIETELESFSKEVNLSLANRMDYAPNLTLAWVPAASDIFEDFGSYNTRVNDELDWRKLKKHQKYLADVFPPEAPRLESSELKNGYIAQSDSITQDLGERIPHADYLLEVRIKKNRLDDFSAASRDLPVIVAFSGQGVYFFLAKRGDDNLEAYANLLQRFSNYLESAKVIRLNNPRFWEAMDVFADAPCPIGFGFRFIGLEAPKDDEGLIDFTEMAQNGFGLDKKLAYDRLGILRLDVDDLGAIFYQGLGAKASFARVASLSREMHLFFAGYFNRIAARHDIYITYSGGDDAFVIGSWYNTLHFAVELRNEFTRFTLGNNGPDGISFSAGLFVCSPFYPVARFEKDAGSLESDAKKYPDQENKSDEALKNAIALFGQVLPWDRFMTVMEQGTALSGIIARQGEIKTKGDQVKFRRSMLHRLLRIISASQENAAGSFESMQQIARLHYLFGRHSIDGTNVLTQFLKDFSSGKNPKEYIIPFTYVFHLSKEARS